MIAYASILVLTALSATIPRVSHGLRTFIAFATALYLIGFRYEVGYDWIVYKDLFDMASSMDLRAPFYNVTLLQTIFAFESGFILVVVLFAQVFGEYEYLQFLLYSIFLLSFWRLGTVMGCRNLPAALLIAHLFVLISLEFSTVRQALALSIFNFGLASWMTGKKQSAYVLFLVATTFQVSVLLYIFALMISVGTRKQTWLVFLIGVIASAPILFPAAFLGSISFAPTFIAEKVEYYLLVREYNNSVADLLFFGVFLTAILLLVSRHLRLLKRSNAPREEVLLATLIIVLTILALSAFPVPTIRNRILYELVVLVALFCFSYRNVGKSNIAFGLCVFGFVYFAATFARPTAFMYVPYQNFIYYKAIGLESDGLTRDDRLRAYLRSLR